MTKTNKQIEHKGIVVQKQGQQVQVQIEQNSACAGCHAKGACTAAESVEKLIDAVSLDTTLRIGDEVVVSVQQKYGFQAVWWAFVLPFLLITGVIALSNQFTTHDSISGTIALCSLIPYYLILSLFKGRLQKKFAFYAHKPQSA